MSEPAQVIELRPPIPYEKYTILLEALQASSEKVQALEKALVTAHRQIGLLREQRDAETPEDEEVVKLLKWLKGYAGKTGRWSTKPSTARGKRVRWALKQKYSLREIALMHVGAMNDDLYVKRGYIDPVYVLKNESTADRFLEMGERAMKA